MSIPISTGIRQYNHAKANALPIPTPTSKSKILLI